MSAPARLLALRLQGFKSFAERTIVEFGPGISAVVGPNGSGKSNLADALRWSLGEQGRALRSRKSEDVIFAGSEKRSALGMADVTLVLDNADGLLPVDYGVLELGRRLYRSGENDYLLNKQRIRLRDLVDLLDAAHLADNAFLFIGQGMVDQALALRPEERRPLFEEVAGVRRHERRRRKAEEQLAESEANLARVEDIVAELRPQARRLAAQAEQQATRLTAADELVSALLAAAHLRWHEAAAQASAAAARVERERRAAASAMADLQSAEDQATAIATELTERAATEQEHLAIHDAARSAVTELRLREARTLADLEALERDRVRLADERATAEASVMSHRRDVAVVVPGRDLELDAAVAEADRLLVEANDELARLRAETHARGEEAAALRRAEAARHAEAEAARRRLAEATRRAADERAAATAAGTRRAELDRRLAAARETLDAAASAAVDATNARDAARSASVDADSRRRAADERAAALESALAARNGHLAAIEGQLREEEERGIARSARRRGGRRLDEELAVDAAARAAVEAALDELARAYIVDGDAVSALAAERGVVVVRERASVDAGDASDPVTRRFEARLGDAGAVRADGVIRRDPTGTVRRVLARTAIVDDLAEALALQPDLPPGWTLVTRDGGAVVDQLAVRLGRGDAPLERRAEVERLRAERERLRVDAEAARGVATTAEAAAHQARRAVESAAAEEAARAAARRRAEEEERAAARDLEAVAREAAWHGAQAERLEAEVERAREALVGLESDGPWSTGAATSDRAAMPAEATTDDVAALDAWQRRAAELRARRDRLAADQAAADARRREVESRLARAEASAAIDEERIRRAERDLAMIVERVESLTEAKRTLAAELGVALERERAAAEALATVRSAAAADRDRLGRAEREASAARERLRAADERLRGADRSDLEARLGRDALREQLLVELAGLGELGRRRLEAEAGVVPIAVGPGRVEERRGADAQDARMPADETGAPESAASDSAVAFQSSVASDGDDSAALESALDALATRWAEETPPADVPGPARLATLRRRYHELGAANPFAVEEYEALRERLETLESQQVDLRAAIEGTRRLIAELNTMIATQFRATFTALETAFDGRFQQLFGGGFARLSLTDPDDLAATGVEIVARPPGKKPQALAMLSGGERALTAVALLFAMLEVRPVPFCVLDEVDAALDEANVGRFSEALRGLADRTQFVVITHNRGTIEVADALYGVTVGDDSVSRVISLRLDEAQAIADRERGATMAEPGGRNGHGDVEPVDELAGVG